MRFHLVIMDERDTRAVVLEVLAEIGMPSDDVVVEPAMGAPDSDSIQVRLPSESGDQKAVVVDFNDKDGNRLDEAGMRERLRKQLAAFKKIGEL